MYDILIYGSAFVGVFSLACLARWADRKAGNEGLIVTKSVSVTIVRNGWSRD